ncbi:putative duf1687 domain-containing protein [Rosellinia necatrix]|uniref:Putative duf1687 domain-containing protein n=1 Tax=Rosellinia necatrix TaxID=77044 RepID=A0A1W2TPC6_ROSNE|nr:putative duf1687 domain-containing protein [Rosellinia necatrix]
MFRFHKTLDIVTLFHKAGSPASIRAATVLKQASANATEAAAEDQASDHSQTSPPRSDFELNITEDPPTADQLRTILDYVGKSKISSVINGATSEKEALKKFNESADNFRRPVVVDWNNGRAIATDQESEILKMLQQINSK